MGNQNQVKIMAAAQYIRLLGLANPDNIVDEGDGVYSHTNSKGRKRNLIPCLTFREYKEKQKIHPDAKVQKCIGYYVMCIEK